MQPRHLGPAAVRAAIAIVVVLGRTPDPAYAGEVDDEPVVMVTPAGEAAADQSGGLAPEPFPLPQVTVSGLAPAAPPTLVVRDVSVDDLEAFNAHTVGDGLTPIPGVNVQYGGTSGDARAWIRGFRDRDTLVLFDGIPIASGFEGTIDLNEIAVDHVAEIKVMKSAPSVIYGVNGMGGVIDIIPRTGSNADLFAGHLELGTNTSRLLRASSGGGDERLNYLVSLSHDEAGEYALSNGYKGDQNQPAGDRLNSDYSRDNLFVSASAADTPMGRISFFYNLSDAEKGLPPTAGTDDPDFERLTVSRRQTVGISGQPSSLPLAVKLYYNSYESELTVYTDGTYSEVYSIDEARDYSVGAKLYATLTTHPNNTVIVHGATQTDVFKAEGELENGNRAELATWTLAVEDQYWMTDTLSVAVGGIFNIFDQTRLNRSTTAFSPQIALGWQASEHLAWHLSAAERTRFPKLRELYRRRYGNPDLDEQTARNYELGLSYSHAPPYSSDLAVFYSEVDGLIERPDRRSLYENLDPVTIKGIELSTHGQLNDSLYGRLSYTYVNARESLPGAPSRQLRSRPEHTAQIELRWSLPRRISIAANGIYVDGLYDLDDDNVYTPIDSYFVVNLKVSKEFSPHLSTYVAMTNVADTDYQQRLGDPRAGRAARLGVDFEL